MNKDILNNKLIIMFAIFVIVDVIVFLIIPGVLYSQSNSGYEDIKICTTENMYNITPNDTLLTNYANTYYLTQGDC